MAIVHLTTQGAKASLDNGRLVVTPPEGALRRLPLAQVAFLIVWGNVTLTTPLMGALLDRGIEVVFLTRHGRFRGRLHGHDTPHVLLRRAQYAAQSKPRWVFRTAQGIVRCCNCCFRRLRVPRVPCVIKPQGEITRRARRTRGGLRMGARMLGYPVPRRAGRHREN